MYQYLSNWHTQSIPWSSTSCIDVMVQTTAKRHIEGQTSADFAHAMRERREMARPVLRFRNHAPSKVRGASSAIGMLRGGSCSPAVSRHTASRAKAAPRNATAAAWAVRPSPLSPSPTTPSPSASPSSGRPPSAELRRPALPCHAPPRPLGATPCHPPAPRPTSRGAPHRAASPRTSLGRCAVRRRDTARSRAAAS